MLLWVSLAMAHPPVECDVTEAVTEQPAPPKVDASHRWAVQIEAGAVDNDGQLSKYAGARVATRHSWLGIEAHADWFVDDRSAGIICQLMVGSYCPQSGPVFRAASGVSPSVGGRVFFGPRAPLLVFGSTGPTVAVLATGPDGDRDQMHAARLGWNTHLQLGVDVSRWIGLALSVNHDSARPSRQLDRGQDRSFANLYTPQTRVRVGLAVVGQLAR